MKGVKLVSSGSFGSMCLASLGRGQDLDFFLAFGIVMAVLEVGRLK